MAFFPSKIWSKIKTNTHRQETLGACFHLLKLSVENWTVSRFSLYMFRIEDLKCNHCSYPLLCVSNEIIFVQSNIYKKTKM